MFVRSIIGLWLERSLRSSIIIQSQYRAYYCKKMFFKVRSGIISLQSFTRRRISPVRSRGNFNFDASYPLMNHHFHNSIPRVLYRYSFHCNHIDCIRKNFVAVKIQAIIRGMVQKRIYVKQVIASCIIQKCVRGLSIRKMYCVVLSIGRSAFDLWYIFSVVHLQSYCRFLLYRRKYVQCKRKETLF